MRLSDNETHNAMKKFGLIGHPIAHSLSPALFKAAYDGKYPYDLIEEDDFEKACDRFLKEYDAINVTAPFKENAYRKADIKSPGCEAIGAANILIRLPDGKIYADNSDQMGVAGAVAAGLDPDRRPVADALVVGCGGAAKAAAYAMCCSGYNTVIINRNLEKARDFAQKLSANTDFSIHAASLDDFHRCFRKAGVIIYTLPVLIPSICSLSRADIRGGILMRKDKIIVEANYKDPAFSQEMISRLEAVNPGLRYVSGKEWLLHQAVGAYRAFTGEDPDIQRMRTAFSPTL